MQPPDPTPEFPSYNEPLPSVPGAPVPGGPARPSRGPVISFDAIGEAWELMKPHIGIWAAAVLVYNIIIGIPISVFYAVTIGSMVAQIQANPTAQPTVGPTYFISLFVFGVITFVLNVYLSGGLFRMALDNVRTGHVEFGRLFSATDVLPQLLVASLLMTIAYFGGIVLCVIPGLLLMSLFMFVFPLILEKKMKAFEALSVSMDALKPQMWMSLVYLIVLSIISQAGVMLCCIGYFVTFPLFLICIAITYRDFYPDDSAPIARIETPYSPLADPNG